MTFAGSLVSTAEGGFVPPGPGSFDLPPVFSVGSVGVTKPMLLLVLARRADVRVLLRSGAPAPDGARQAAVRRREHVRRGAQRPRPRHHRQPGLHAVRALPRHALLLHPAQQLVRVDPVHPVPVVQPREHGLRPGRSELGHLQLGGRPQARPPRLPQAAVRAGRRHRTDPDPDRPARVLLEPHRPADHAGAASVRQHVRRPHPGAAVRDRRRVPPRARARPSSSRSACWPGCSPSRSPSWSCWCSSSRPTSSPCSTRCTSQVHSQTSTEPDP